MWARTGWLKPSLSFKHQAQAADRAALLTQLAQQLTSLALPAHTAVSISLASDIVRFMVLPALAIAMSPSEKQAYASAVFKQTYGAAAAQWLVRVDDNAPGQASVACAMDAALSEALMQLMQQHRLRLIQLQPYVISAFNRLLPKLGLGAQCILLLEPQRVVLLLCHHQIIHDIRIEKYVGDWQAVAKHMLAREQLRAEVAITQVLLHAPVASVTHLDFLDDLQVKVTHMATAAAFKPAQFGLLEVFR